jgi:hypothetical protein
VLASGRKRQSRRLFRLAVNSWVPFALDSRTIHSLVVLDARPPTSSALACSFSSPSSSPHLSFCRLSLCSPLLSSPPASLLLLAFGRSPHLHPPPNPTTPLPDCDHITTTRPCSAYRCLKFSSPRSFSSPYQRAPVDSAHSPLPSTPLDRSNRSRLSNPLRSPS